MNRMRATRRLAVLVLALAASCATEDAPASREAVYLDRSPEQWIADFRSPEHVKRDAAVEALKRFHAEDVVPLLAKELGDNDAEVRFAAVTTLAAFGEDALPAAETVAAHVADPTPAVRGEAARALMLMGERSAAFGRVPLSGALMDEDWYVRWRAVKALEAYGASGWPEGYDALRAIEHKDRDERVRKDAMTAADHIAFEHTRPPRFGQPGRRRDDATE